MFNFTYLYFRVKCLFIKKNFSLLVCLSKCEIINSNKVWTCKVMYNSITHCYSGMTNKWQEPGNQWKRCPHNTKRKSRSFGVNFIVLFVIYLFRTISIITIWALLFLWRNISEIMFRACCVMGIYHYIWARIVYKIKFVRRLIVNYCRSFWF